MSKVKITLWEQFVLILASGFGAGYFPVAPGTAGSLLAALIAWFIQWNNFLFGLFILLFFFLGIWICENGEKRWGSDNRKIVFDEMFGMFLTFFLVQKKELFLLFLGFIVFRFFDILKPPPARQSQKFKRGWGVMFDDLVAGIYSNLVMQVVVRKLYV